MTKPTRLRDIKVSARDQLMLDPKDIAIEKGHNPRNYHLPENRAHLDELKSSIKISGVLIPLLVRWDVASKQCVLVDGECRLQAVLELRDEGNEIKAVPTVQVSGTNEADRLVTALTANTGKPLSKWEIGSAFQRFIKWGWMPEQIVSKTGFSERYIRESMELSDAPEDVKQLLSLEAVTPSLALQHIRTDGAGAGAKLKEKVEKAKSTAKPTKKGKPSKVIVKRERKQSGVKLSKEESKSIARALRVGAKSDDKEISEACQCGLECLETAMSK